MDPVGQEEGLVVLLLEDGDGLVWPAFLLFSQQPYHETARSFALIPTSLWWPLRIAGFLIPVQTRACKIQAGGFHVEAKVVDSQAEAVVTTTWRLPNLAPSERRHTAAGLGRSIIWRCHPLPRSRGRRSPFRKPLRHQWSNDQHVVP